MKTQVVLAEKDLDGLLFAWVLKEYTAADVKITYAGDDYRPEFEPYDISYVINSAALRVPPGPDLPEAFREERNRHVKAVLSTSAYPNVRTFPGSILVTASLASQWIFGEIGQGRRPPDILRYAQAHLLQRFSPPYSREIAAWMDMQDWRGSERTIDPDIATCAYMCDEIQRICAANSLEDCAPIHNGSVAVSVCNRIAKNPHISENINIPLIFSSDMQLTIAGVCAEKYADKYPFAGAVSLKKMERGEDDTKPTTYRVTTDSVVLVSRDHTINMGEYARKRGGYGNRSVGYFSMGKQPSLAIALQPDESWRIDVPMPNYSDWPY